LYDNHAARYRGGVAKRATKRTTVTTLKAAANAKAAPKRERPVWRKGERPASGVLAVRLEEDAWHMLDALVVAHGCNGRSDAVRVAIEVAFAQRPRR